MECKTQSRDSQSQTVCVIRRTDGEARPGDGNDLPVQAFHSRDKALDACRRLNAQPGGGGPDTSYDVVQVQLADAPDLCFARALFEAKNAKARAVEAARAAFLIGAQGLFAANPDLKSFGWKQYTRDCFRSSIHQFTVDTDRPGINGRDGDEIYHGWAHDPRAASRARCASPAQRASSSPLSPSSWRTSRMRR